VRGCAEYPCKFWEAGICVVAEAPRAPVVCVRPLGPLVLVDNRGVPRASALRCTGARKFCICSLLPPGWEKHPPHEHYLRGATARPSGALTRLTDVSLSPLRPSLRVRCIPVQSDGHRRADK